MEDEMTNQDKADVSENMKIYKPRGRVKGYKRSLESIAKQRETRAKNKENKTCKPEGYIDNKEI